MLQIVLGEAVCGKLPFDRIAGATGTVAPRATALNNKTFDCPVNGQPIIKTLRSQPEEVCYCVRGLILIHFQFDLATVLHFDNYHHADLLSKCSFELISVQMPILSLLISLYRPLIFVNSKLEILARKKQNNPDCIEHGMGGDA